MNTILDINQSRNGTYSKSAASKACPREASGKTHLLPLVHARLKEGEILRCTGDIERFGTTGKLCPKSIDQVGIIGRLIILDVYRD
jgi:hypothetical protein